MVHARRVFVWCICHVCVVADVAGASLEQDEALRTTPLLRSASSGEGVLGQFAALVSNSWGSLLGTEAAALAQPLAASAATLNTVLLEVGARDGGLESQETHPVESLGFRLHPSGTTPRPMTTAPKVAAKPTTKGSHHRPLPPPQPFFDGFFFAYWGAVAVLMIVTIYLTRVWRDKLHRERTASGEVVAAGAAAASPADAADEAESGSDEVEENTLSENLWALNLVAVLGKVKFGNGEKVPAWCVFGICAFMGTLQLAAIALMVGSIDPHAEPVTDTPGSPWLRHSSPMPINLMKWFMVTFLTVGQVGEVAQCRRLVTETLLINEDRMVSSRFFPLVAGLLQYIVSISVVWAGVAVIVCFQTVPDIVYSSMSLFFITSADEMFFECLDTICDLDCDWELGPTKEEREEAKSLLSQSQTVPVLASTNSWSVLGVSSSVGGDGKLQHHIFGEPLFENKHLPHNLWWVLKFLQIFPMFFGFFVLSRAFYTNIMPTQRFNFAGIW